MSKVRNLVKATVLAGALLSPIWSWAGTHTFQLKIPRRVSPGATAGAGGPCEMTAVKFTMSFATNPGVTITSIGLQITEPDKQHNGSPAEMWPTVPQALTPSMSPVSHTFQVPPPFGGVTPLFGDTVTISAPDKTNLAGYDSGNYQRYEIDVSLASNYDLLGKSYQQNDPDIYTIVATVATSGAAETVSGMCAESYDPLNRSIVGASCATATPYFVPLSDPQTQLVFDGTTQTATQCFRERPGVDAFLVLDKSGSMASPTLGTVSQPKIMALQQSVRDFVQAWDDTRTFFDTTAPNDKIGVALFDSTATSWTDGGLVSGLNTFAGADTKILSNLNPATCNNTVCGQLVPGTSTSIGAGLLAADPGFPSDGNRHVVLLMSDGMQNTDPIVTPFDAASATPCAPAAPKAIATITGGDCATAALLPHESSSNYQIHTVTVGTGLAVSPAINQQIAQLTGGFYINTEDNSGDQLKPFFLELLQNVLKFNSFDTIRLISQTVPPAALPYSTSTPVSTTSHDVEFNLTWPRSGGALRLTVTPPGGAQPIVEESASGFISIVRQLPLPAPFDPTANWGIKVEAVALPSAAALSTTQEPFPFDIFVMADDGATKSDLSVVPADYKAGGNIRLRAKLTMLGRPILGLGSHASDKIQADLIKPGQSVGDMLSDSTSSSSSTAPDVQPGAEAKLFNTLRDNPSALKHASDTVQLYDDGKPEHGDDIAGDGIYSALYPATLPGHYNFLFSIESTDQNSVRFSRQQLRTAYVRSVPDAGNTVFQTSILRRDNTNLLSIVMTPRGIPGPGCSKNDPTCGRMGPAWANYFWFTSAGHTPFKAKDNLDGTYTATMSFSGATPPPVSVHFEDVIALIGDSVPPEKLPQPLGPGNVLTVVPCCGGTGGRYAFFLDAGANLRKLGSDPYLGFSLNAGLEYMATNWLAFDQIFGYHRFSRKFAADPDIYEFSVNARAYLTNFPVRLFVNGGLGGYKFGGSSTSLGGNGGGGLLFQWSKRIGTEFSYNYHAVNDTGSTRFSTFEAGLWFKF